MRKVALFGALGALVGWSALAQAQTPRTLCDVNDPANKCPGVNCACVPDAFIMTFDDTTTSLKEYADFTAGMPVNITISSDTKTEGVQGWSYGVAHDVEALDITAATIDGTDAKGLFDIGFDATSKDDIQLCLTEKCDKTDPAQRKDGGGFISAVVLSLTKPVILPNNAKSTIVKASYTMKKDVGTTGTTITLSDKLAKKNSPPTDINLTVTGKSRLWTTATEGLIKKTGGAGETICDDGLDNDEDGKIDCLDSDCPACPPEVCTGGLDEDKDGKIDCLDEDCAGNEACKETLCDDGLDNDGDTKIDCADEDCPNFPCAGAEICNDTIDNDEDGKIDCADEDCASQCPETNCTDGVDNDTDGKIDCLDSDCPACPPEVCTGGLDEDKDGKIDCLDEDCATNPACVVACLDGYALYFGPAATDQTVAVAGNDYVVTSRNKLQALAFQLGVKVTGAAAPFGWEFKGDMGADADRVVELIITDANGDSQTPQTPNKVTATIKDVLKVEKGSAIATFAGDFFAVDLAPALNGPGFTVGYLADLNPPPGGGNKIPATAATGTPCPVNEILKVSLGTGDGAKFSRGDADGNGKINISDAVLIIQNIVGNLPKRFQCDDILDANDDGALNVTDAIPVLNYIFQRNPLGPPLAAPFKTCATDPTADTLSCAAGVTTNCN